MTHKYTESKKANEEASKKSSKSSGEKVRDNFVK